jgi:hypothetical protein
MEGKARRCRGVGVWAEAGVWLFRAPVGLLRTAGVYYQTTSLARFPCWPYPKTRCRSLAVGAGLPYRTVLTIACIILAGRYLFDRGAAGRGKWLVGTATVASFSLPTGLAWYITSVLTQLAVSLFVLLRMRAAAE